MPFTHSDFEGVRRSVQRDTHLIEAALHPDDAAVDALAVQMKAKLAKQRAKGYGGWDNDCTQQRLSDLLLGHVGKGDPVDVANFCAFLLARGEGITSTTIHETARLQARVAELEGVLRDVRGYCEGSWGEQRIDDALKGLV